MATVDSSISKLKNDSYYYNTDVKQSSDVSTPEQINSIFENDSNSEVNSTKGFESTSLDNIDDSSYDAIIKALEDEIERKSKN